MINPRFPQVTSRSLELRSYCSGEAWSPPYGVVKQAGPAGGDYPACHIPPIWVTTIRPLDRPAMARSRSMGWPIGSRLRRKVL